MSDNLSPGALQPGVNCWRIETAARASVIVDADDYFSICRAAMLRARHRIMLVGWDFDARIRLCHPDMERDDEAGPATVGELILWLVERTPGLEIFILRWDVGALKSLAHGTTLMTVVQWMLHPRVSVRLDGAHPTAASHHQKIVVMDDSFAFCGGIDMTDGRWDTRQHLDDDPGRVGPDGAPHPPWHDATCALDGPAAAALGALCRTRWERAGGDALPAIATATDCWPPALPVDFEQVAMGIARTEPEMPEWAAATEIEQLTLDMIARARHAIYAESQYFASRRIAEELAKRLDEDDGPDIVIVNPISSQGWLEPMAMDSARARLFETLRRRDTHKRLRIYHPYSAGGAAIYVHAKIMIIDEQMIKIGSSNFNNRSMRLDTECDLVIDVAVPQNEDASARIVALRDDLLAEHLGVDPGDVSAAMAKHGRLIAAIEALSKGSDRLRPYSVPELSVVEEWLAENEVFDPNGPSETFENLTDRGLLQNFRMFSSGD